MDERETPKYDEREAQPSRDATRVQMAKITHWMIAHNRIPTVPEVMEITGYRYHWASAVRRKVLREFPRIDMEDIADAVKDLLLRRVRGEEIDNTDLVRLMPWVAPQKSSAVDVKQEITHRFMVIKPGEDAPAEEEAEDN